MTIKNGLCHGNRIIAINSQLSGDRKLIPIILLKADTHYCNSMKRFLITYPQQLLKI